MNKRGQALVEFILIVPVLVMILFCLIDFGNIFSNKIVIEGNLDKAFNIYEENKTYDEIKNAITTDGKTKLNITNENNEYIKINIKRKIDIITPGLNNIIGSPFYVSVDRFIKYE